MACSACRYGRLCSGCERKRDIVPSDGGSSREAEEAASGSRGRSAQGVWGEGHSSVLDIVQLWGARLTSMPCIRVTGILAKEMDEMDPV